LDFVIWQLEILQSENGKILLANCRITDCKIAKWPSSLRVFGVRYRLICNTVQYRLDIIPQTSNPSCFSPQAREGVRKANLRVRVFYHDKCFDGACSAALFSRFYRERIRSDVDFVYSGLLHRAGALFDEKQFDGDENAIVDFKYSSSPKITWWFDHHESAFLSPADAAHFEQDQSNRKFYDPAFKSCTSFIAMIAKERFGFDPRPVPNWSTGPTSWTAPCTKTRSPPSR
jgi:hypothetical protein